MDANTTRKLVLTTAAVVVLALFGVNYLAGRNGSGPMPSDAPASRSPSSSSGALGRALAPRCSPASQALLDAIGTRLTPEYGNGMSVPGGVTLADAEIVRSGDFDELYFVGVRIEGESMGGIAGVWATDDPSGGGAIWAVSGRARQFSDWPDRSELEPEADGFREADLCGHVPGVLR